jgi:DNA-binding response OmpR family regulator
LKHVLEDNGIRVDVFRDPILALENLKPNFYDLLIIDTNMCKVNGLELYDEIKKIDHKARVCFLTASQTYAYGSDLSTYHQRRQSQKIIND